MDRSNLNGGLERENLEGAVEHVAGEIVGDSMPRGDGEDRSSPQSSIEEPTPTNGATEDIADERRGLGESDALSDPDDPDGYFPSQRDTDVVEGEVAALPPEEEAKRLGVVDELRRFHAEGTEKTWQAAFRACQLSEEFDMTNRRIAQESGVSEQYIGQYIRAVKVAKQAMEETGEDYTKLVSVDMAYKSYLAHRSFRGPEKDATSVVEVVMQAATGVSPRKLRSTAAKNGKRKQIQKCLDRQTGTINYDWRANCFEGDCRELFKNGILTPGTVKLAHADVPYADHRRSGDKGYASGRRSTSACLSSCANNNYEDALRLTCDLASGVEPFLEMGGVFALWQAGTRPLRVPIQNSIESGSLHVAFECHLDKASSDDSSEAGQPGAFSEPYSIASEKLVIIKRPTDDLVRCDHGLPRGDLIKRNYVQQAVEQFERERGVQFYRWGMANPKLLGAMPGRRIYGEVSAGRSDIGDVHEMQKAEEHALLLLMKHCLPGDLVVDFCGASASFCIAADQYGCRWIYCDMPTELDADGNQLPNSGNFAFGIKRLADYFEWKSRNASGDEEGGACVTP